MNKTNKLLEKAIKTITISPTKEACEKHEELDFNKFYTFYKRERSCMSGKEILFIDELDKWYDVSLFHASDVVMN
jgi:CRISPR/Cas system Type II protein with McrA/HNH and RuvC-like nuclease domain